MARPQKEEGQATQEAGGPTPPHQVPGYGGPGAGNSTAPDYPPLTDTNISALPFGNGHVPAKPKELIRLPGVVWQAWNAGRVVLPQYLKGSQKASCVAEMARFDDRNLTLEELEEAANRDWDFWAFRLGHQTGFICLDFDERHGGMETFSQLDLPAHTETPRHGRHIYVRHPGGEVGSVGQPGPPGFPGMEVLGDRKLVTFYSKHPQFPYRRRSRPLLALTDLPDPLAEAIVKRKGSTKGSTHGKPKDSTKGSPKLPAAVQVMIDKLGDSVQEVRPGQWEGLCPLHDDTDPSFGFGLGDDRLIVISCQAQEHELEDFADYFGLNIDEFNRRPEASESAEGRQVINVSGKELHDLADDAIAALASFNSTEPRLFVRGGVPVSLVQAEFGMEAEPHNFATLRVLLSQVARWEKTVIRKDGPSNVLIRPDDHVVGHLLAQREYVGFPTIDRFAEAPFFAPDGTIVTKAGFHEMTRTYLDPAPSCADVKLPKHITDDMVRRALRFLSRELLVDFPFASKTDSVHALTLLLLPFLRECIPGIVPPYLFNAPKPGSGKGMLSRMLLYPSVGENIGSIPELESSAEYRKQISTQLMKASSVVYLDNVTGTFGSGGLASAFTAKVWEDRILGVSRNIKARVRNLWVVTGNNLRLTGDMPRRFVLVRLAPKVERPYERSDWHHENLEAWVERHRRDLVIAALVICQAWVERGMPQLPEPTMGSFESFAAVMGGVLQVCGLDQWFLGNREELYGSSETEDPQIAALLEAWHDRFDNQAVSSSEVAKEMEQGRLREAVPDALTPYLFRGDLIRRVGNLLRDCKDGIYGDLQLKGRTPRGHSAKWWVQKMKGGGEG